MDSTVKKILVCGGHGFIGHHLANRLASQGHDVYTVDLKFPEYPMSEKVSYRIGDLREQWVVASVFEAVKFDEVYQLAADMGGAGFIFTGEHDADIMHNSAQINLNVATQAVKTGVKKLFYSSSACIYPAYNQEDPENPKTSEASAYPAAPDSEYGWEKLFSERLYLSFKKNHGLDVKIARFHNIFGPEGTYKGGREKSPAAICRKTIEAAEGGEIEIWGDGNQTRSFLYIDECLDGIERLMASEESGPINIGSDEMVTINHLAELAMEFKGKKLSIKHIDGPLGVRGRTSDNTLIQEKLGWKPTQPLKVGLEKTYRWIESQLSQ